MIYFSEIASMTDSQLQYLKSYRQGMSELASLNMINHVKLAFERHKTVLVMTNDQQGALTRLRRWFPTNLMELCDNGVRIYRR